MTTAIVRVENISKQYRLGARREAYATLRETVSRAMRAPVRRFRHNGPSGAGTVWALREVSFAVTPGEVVGIIGRNGAGKSTLLKILSRITEPTSGRVELFGRIGSLLEVGTGFHPELTGRENIYLNGAVLGMKRAEITARFDEIVAFAEIDEFLDTPVKHYSSGMYMRLAFAVAAHLEPEILLIDEVLAVGDASFQKKCLGKLGDVATQGRTVLFISHNMSAVQNLCARVLWIKNGRIAEAAEAATVVSKYLKAERELTSERVWDVAPIGNEKVRIHRVAARPADNTAAENITIETPLQLEVDYWNAEPNSRLGISLHVFNEHGVLVFASMPLQASAWDGKPLGLFRSVCQVPGGLLNDGSHHVSLFIVRDEHEVIFSLQDVIVFEVLDAVERRGNWHGKWPGVVRPNLEWKTEYLGKEANTNTDAADK